MTQVLGLSDTGTMTGYYNGSHSSNNGFIVSGPYSGKSSWKFWNYPGSTQTQIVAINANGTIVVGFFITRTGSRYGFVKNGNKWWSVAYPNSGKQSFNQLTSINSNGMATGFFKDSTGRTQSYLYNTRTRVFILIVVPMRATTVIITAINNTGVIVGFIVTRNTTIAFVIRNNVFITLVFGNKTNTRAMGINSSGVVVGSFVAANGTTHGFMWTSTGMHQIDAPWTTRTTVITAINNRGQVVGIFVDTRGRTRAFVVVFVVAQATNWNWGWNGSAVAPVPPGTPMPGTSAPGGTTAMSGTHW